MTDSNRPHSAWWMLTAAAAVAGGVVAIGITAGRGAKEKVHTAVAITRVVPRIAIVKSANGRIAFVRGDRIYTVNPSPHAAPTKVPTDDVGVTWSDPAWAPNGKRIAAVSDASSADCMGCVDLELIRSNGKSTIVSFSSSETYINANPAWSPDGRKIVFTGEDGISGGVDLYVVDVSSGETRGLGVRIRGHYATAAWSPDGRWICFDDGLEYGLYLVKPTGGGLKRLNSSGYAPSWAPDGSRIVFSAATGIASISPNGSGLKRLTHRSGDRTPVWSPDKRLIAFVHGGDLWLMSSNGKHQRLLTRDAGSPDWQRR